MKRKQFSEEQIIGILKEAEAGAVVTEPRWPPENAPHRPMPCLAGSLPSGLT